MFWILSSSGSEWDSRKRWQGRASLRACRRPGQKPKSHNKPENFESAAWRAAVPERRKPAARLIPSSKYLKPFPKGMTLPCPGELVEIQDKEKCRKFELRPDARPCLQRS